MSQYVPIGARSLLDGKRLPVEDRDRQALGDEPCLHIGGTNARIVYRLDVTDPCDQREIWRLAALDLLDEEWGAASAILVQTDLGWSFFAAWDQSDEDFSELWICAADNIESATLALCAYVWGPE